MRFACALQQYSSGFGQIRIALAFGSCIMHYSSLFLLLEVVIDSHINSWSFSMDSQLGEFEEKHQITQHWKPAYKEFVDAKYSYFEEKQQLLSCHEDSYREVTVPVNSLGLIADISAYSYLTIAPPR